MPVKLAKPAERALANAGIKTLKGFSRFSEKEIGQNAMVAIQQALIKNKLSFKK